MKKISSKSGLAVQLSRIKGFFEPKVRLEQYPTDSEIAAEILWNCFLKGEIEEKVIADYGCGTGILGLGVLLLGAKKVFFIDIDEDALNIAKNNYLFLKSERSDIGEAVFICKNIEDFSEKTDLVVQNPPFGAKREGKKHIDLVFLKKALENSGIVYSFHKSETKPYILDKFCKENGCLATETYDFDFPIKASYDFHKKRILRTKVSCIRFERKGI